MIAPRYIPLVFKQVIRHTVRSGLTVGGVATAIFLFIAVQAMQGGVQTATQKSATDNTLVVYREDRFCPFTSRLPKYYVKQIEQIEGVHSVVPMKIVVNNCRASLDVVTFRGVSRDRFIEHYSATFNIIDGTIDSWRTRSDAALLGETLAMRRGLKVGDRFDAAGVTSYVAAVFRSDQPQDQNVAYVHLDFLQQTVDRNLGTVTQFNVTVDEPAQMEDVAASIDKAFQHREHPTTTRAQKAFVAYVAAEMIELIHFTSYMAWGCLFAVLALVGNAMVMSVQDRIKDHAIMRTLGYRDGLISQLIISEGIVLALVGGAVGTIGAMAVIQWTQFSLSVDGLNIPIEVNTSLFLIGLLIAVALGVVAGLAPAWQALRRSIAVCLRAA